MSSDFLPRPQAQLSTLLIWCLSAFLCCLLLLLVTFFLPVWFDLVSHSLPGRVIACLPSQKSAFFFLLLFRHVLCAPLSFSLFLSRSAERTPLCCCFTSFFNHRHVSSVLSSCLLCLSLVHMKHRQTHFPAQSRSYSSLRSPPSPTFKPQPPFSAFPSLP